MNTHFCKVGNVRPKMDSVDDSIEVESNSIETKAEKKQPNSKSE